MLPIKVRVWCGRTTINHEIWRSRRYNNHMHDLVAQTQFQNSNRYTLLAYFLCCHCYSYNAEYLPVIARFCANASLHFFHWFSALWNGRSYANFSHLRRLVRWTSLNAVAHAMSATIYALRRECVSEMQKNAVCPFLAVTELHNRRTWIIKSIQQNLCCTLSVA